MDPNGNSSREITFRAAALGIILSVILAAANAYLGLFAGMTVSASIPAAVVSMGVLRLLRRGNILENNIVQTAASAGESLAAGVIFTIPALLLIGYWEEFDFTWITLIAALGGLLGVLFTVPLRRALILQQRLKFPEGVATAEVLKSAHQGGSNLMYIAQAAAAAGSFKFAASGLRIWSETIEVARRFQGTIAYFGSSLSPALVGVGYIVGLNIAVLVFLGGAFNWLIVIPVYSLVHDWPTLNGQAVPALDWAGQIWSEKTRYIGVGAMLVGGLWTVFKLRGSLLRGFRTGIDAYRGANDGKGRTEPSEMDIPTKWVLILIIFAVVPLFILYELFVHDITVSVPMAGLMLVAGFLFSAVAAYMAGLVGSSNNPISGVTIATVLVSAVLLAFLMGSAAPNGPAAAILIGSVVCCAAAIAGDNMQDLKAGHIVGATPWKQQLMQIVGTLSAALVIAPVLVLLQKAYGFAGHASATKNALAAPQANLIASVARGIFFGRLPWQFVLLGSSMAVTIIILDEYLAHSRASFRTPVLAVAIGIYLPLQLEVPIFVGGLLHNLVVLRQRRKGRPAIVDEQANQAGLLVASGLITGEALMGILLAVPIVISADPNILAVFSKPTGAWPGVLLLTGIAWWLYSAASAKDSPVKAK